MFPSRIVLYSASPTYSSTLTSLLVTAEKNASPQHDAATTMCHHVENTQRFACWPKKFCFHLTRAPPSTCLLCLLHIVANGKQEVLAVELCSSFRDAMGLLAVSLLFPSTLV
ncbi:hypothetical protein ILYODFUR_033388 [Ilyodon furcidens]|uniref:Uncharacterized protein n=1 Tax=Ilyodon furcidens TaxID=33524 RepID=A0ABV0TDF2_9TELE